MKYAQLILLLSLTTTQLFCADQRIRKDLKDEVVALGISALIIGPLILLSNELKENARKCAEPRNGQIATHDQLMHFYSEESLDAFREIAVKQLKIEALLKSDRNVRCDGIIIEQKKEKKNHRKSSRLLLNANNRKDTKRILSHWNNLS